MLGKTIAVPFILFIFSVYTTEAQHFNLGFGFFHTVQKTEEPYRFDGIGIDQTYLQMSYNSTRVVNPAAAKKLKGKSITEVDLIYTRLPFEGDFEQLTKQRLAALYALVPQAFESPMTRWRFVEQTGANRKNRYDYFHGFAIRYKDVPTFAVSMGTIDRTLATNKANDSLLIKVFERNNWDEMLVVADVTGSMGPYLGDFLLWLKLTENRERTKHYCFFQDGDNKLNSDKEIGKTGGIYMTKSKKFDPVYEVIKKAMSMGNGGDGPENDVEALYKGIKECPGCKEVVLIADNFAAMRDLALIKELKKLKKPIRVVLCGGANGLNREYLDLARHTGGSVHLIEEDIENLMGIREGDQIELAGQCFRIRNGRFMPVQNPLTEM